MNALPRDSATVRSLDPDYAGTGWDTNTELLAVIAEIIDQHSRWFYMANSKKNAKQPKPLNIPRPGKVEIKPPEKKKVSSLEAMQAMWDSGVQVYKEEG